MRGPGLFEILIALAALAAGCDGGAAASVEAPAPRAVVAPSSRAVPRPDELRATAAGLAIERIDVQIEHARKRAAEQGGWIHLGRVADLYLHRVRLSGDVGDYVRAEAALEEAFRNAAKGSGPLLTRAWFNMTVHRAGLVEADVAQFERRPLKKTDELATIAGLRGDVAVQRGEVEKALAAFQRAEALHPTLATAGRIASYYRTRGDLDEAARWYDRAIDRADDDDRMQRAWALVQRGAIELEQQRHVDALTYFERADRSFDGWFMVETRIAEAKLELGAVDEARALYESIVARVPNGAAMAGLAKAWRRAGDAARAQEWQNAATAAFERDLRRMPSAVAAHALDFFLIAQPDRALQIARQNVDLRPGPQARSKLAQALLITGRGEEARAVLTSAP